MTDKAKSPLRISSVTMARLASSPCRPCQPRPTQGDIGHRALPDRSPRRPCRALRRLRLYHDRLQFLPQSALPDQLASYDSKKRGAHV
jgi:hypothetical protein